MASELHESGEEKQVNHNNTVFLIKRHKKEVDKIIKNLFELKDKGEIIYTLTLMDAIESLHVAGQKLEDIVEMMSKPIE